MKQSGVTYPWQKEGRQMPEARRTQVSPLLVSRQAGQALPGFTKETQPWNQDRWVSWLCKDRNPINTRPNLDPKNTTVTPKKMSGSNLSAQTERSIQHRGEKRDSRRLRGSKRAPVARRALYLGSELRESKARRSERGRR